MNLTSYIALQKQVETYRINLHKIEDKLAVYGGYVYAPLDVQNQYDQTKEKIDNLVQDLHQIELRMIDEISTIRNTFKERENKIEQLTTQVKDLETFLRLYIQIDNALSTISQERSFYDVKFSEYDENRENRAIEQVEMLRSYLSGLMDVLRIKYYQNNDHSNLFHLPIN